MAERLLSADQMKKYLKHPSISRSLILDCGHELYEFFFREANVAF